MSVKNVRDVGKFIKKNLNNCYLFLFTKHSLRNKCILKQFEIFVDNLHLRRIEKLITWL